MNLVLSSLTAMVLLAGDAAGKDQGGWKFDPNTLRLTGPAFTALLRPVGDMHGLNTLEHQPAKVAAMEGLWETQRGAPLNLFGLPDQERETTRFAVEIPNLSSLILTHKWDGEVKGLKEYVKEYFEPMFFLAPLNVVGEIAKVISISFRLFGNIMGGSIIIIVVSHLIWGLLLPPFLYAFFALFVGTVQAFVFMMLTLVYISVQIR